jgi:hypothetical protein
MASPAINRSSCTAGLDTSGSRGRAPSGAESNASRKVEVDKIRGALLELQHQLVLYERRGAGSLLSRTVGRSTGRGALWLMMNERARNIAASGMYGVGFCLHRPHPLACSPAALGAPRLRMKLHSEAGFMHYCSRSSSFGRIR